MRKGLLAEAVLLALLAGGCPLLPGCSAEYWAGAFKPTTRLAIKAGPYSGTFEDSKNNNVEMRGLVFDPVTKTYKLESLVIVNNSSDVVKATGERADAVARAQLTQVAYVQAVGNMISQIIGSAGAAAPGIIKELMTRLPSQTSTDLGLPGGISIGQTHTTGSQPAP